MGLLEPISLNGKPQGKCFAKECAKCAFYRPWQIVEGVEQKRSIHKKCSWEALFYSIPKISGSIDGCQVASNEARNAVLQFGEACVRTFEKIKDQIPKFGGGNGNQKLS